MAHVVSSALVDRSGSHAVEQTKVVMCYMEGGQGWGPIVLATPPPKKLPFPSFFYNRSQNEKERLATQK